MIDGGMILHKAEDGEVDEATINSPLIVRNEGAQQVLLEFYTTRRTKTAIEADHADL